MTSIEDFDSSARAATVSSYFFCLANPNSVASSSSPACASVATRRRAAAKSRTLDISRSALAAAAAMALRISSKRWAVRVTAAAFEPPRRAAQQLAAQRRGQIHPDTGFNREFGVVFRLRHDDRKSRRGNPRAGIADDPAADARIMAGQQRIGNDFLQPPAARDGQQVLLAFRFRDLDQVFFAQARGLPQHRSVRSQFRRALPNGRSPKAGPGRSARAGCLSRQAPGGR